MPSHPYGHGKVENFSAFVETGLLLLTAAVHHLGGAAAAVFPRSARSGRACWPSAFWAWRLGIDVVRSRALGRVARQYASEALEADALHFSTDVWSTLVVILGIGTVWLGERTGLTWLRYADPLAALGVAAVIIWVGARLGRRTWTPCWTPRREACRSA